MFSVYATNPLIGSPAEMYQLLKEAGIKRPVAGNQDGSYVTLKSNFALIIGVIQLCSGSGTVFLDQAYWQRAIASRRTTAVRAYILGGLAWFAIPFGFSTTLGLSAVALADHPGFPTYPNPLSASQITAGLASPFAASALLGKGGAVALLIVLFMAVTSCASAELIAVSSVLTFDIYKTYVKPNASPNQLIASDWNRSRLVVPCDGPSYRRRRFPCCLCNHLERSDKSWCNIRSCHRPCSWTRRLACDRKAILWHINHRNHRKRISDSCGKSCCHHDWSHCNLCCFDSQARSV